MPMWGYPYGYGMGGVMWMIVGWLIFLALLGALVWGILHLIDARTSHTYLERPHANALEILQQRYARGEIDEATFERMRERLTAQQITAPSEPIP